jgi:hypothetical protein
MVVEEELMNDGSDGGDVLEEEEGLLVLDGSDVGGQWFHMELLSHLIEIEIEIRRVCESDKADDSGHDLYRGSHRRHRRHHHHQVGLSHRLGKGHPLNTFLFFFLLFFSFLFFSFFSFFFWFLF